MCGFAALLRLSGDVSEEAPRRVLSALRHRGPDGEAVETHGPCTLLHTRLAIIDLAGGDQPLRSEDGRVITVVNGEIYNHRDLRRELEAAGHVFATHSDCEVVVHGYEEYGLGFLQRLNGMFGLALWDDRRGRLLLARDAFGVKPVYWWSDGRDVAAASEVRPLLDAGVARAELDPVALDHFLAWRFVPAPRTMFRGISKLAAAEALVAESGQVRKFSYRTAPGAPTQGDARELEEELARELGRAVERQMMSDVPYGAFLSGGADSAAIVAAMRRARPDRAPLTYTIGFPGHGDAIDEREAAARTAALLGARHAATTLAEQAFPDAVARSVRSLEEPCGIPSAPALLEVSGFARREVKVVLSGQGADEPLGGYQRHQAAAALRLAALVPPSAAAVGRRAAEALPRNERAKRAARLLGVRDPQAALLGTFAISSEEDRGALRARAGEAAAAERAGLARAVLVDVGGRDLLEQALYLDTHLFLPDNLLIYGDKMSMAHALEQRVPFLDVELMRFVERIPGALRVRRGRRKWLYRRSLRRVLPPEILQRRKAPFATPYDDWLRASLGREVERRYAPELPLAEWIAPAAVSRLVDEHRRGRADHKRLLYCLLELAYWRDEWLV